jgi:hypothetical protein
MRAELLVCVAQEVTATNFFRELRYTFNTYRSMYCLFTVFAIMIVRARAGLRACYVPHVLHACDMLCGVMPSEEDSL